MGNRRNILISEKPNKGAKHPCLHHWVIEPPNRLTSIGVCRICGDEQEFQNHLSDTSWNSPRAAWF